MDPRPRPSVPDILWERPAASPKGWANICLGAKDNAAPRRHELRRADFLPVVVPVCHATGPWVGAVRQRPNHSIFRERRAVPIEPPMRTITEPNKPKRGISEA